MKELVVLHDDNGTFTDYSQDARDYLRDTFQISYTTAEDYIYIGLYKPFNQLYVEFENVASASINLTFEYSDGSAGFNALEVEDDTKAFKRSGFISWGRNIEDWQENSIDSKSLFWIRITADADFVADFNGLNRTFYEPAGQRTFAGRANRQKNRRLSLFQRL